MLIMASAPSGCPLASAQTSPSDAPPTNLTIDGQIRSVVVYASGQARFTQTALLPDAAGWYQLTISPIPRTVRPASLGVSVPDGVQLLSSSIAFGTDDHAFQANLAALRQPCRILRDQVNAIQAQLAVIDKEQALYDALAERTAGEAADSLGRSAVDLDEVSRVAAFLAERNAELAKRRFSLKSDLEPLHEQLQAAESALNEAISTGAPVRAAVILTIRIPFDLTGEDATPQVEMAYLADGVGWQPVYDVRADVAASRTAIQLDALIVQNTGLDWNDVTVTVSTGSPESPTTPPTLDTIPIAVRGNLTPPDATNQASEKALMLTADIGAVLPGRTPASGSSPVTDDLSGILVSFTADEPTTIPSLSEQPLRIRLADWRLRTTFNYVAAPLVSQHAYVRAVLRNDSSSHWPSGQALMYRDGTRIGAAVLPHVHPGQRFQLAFGTDNLISLQRQMLGRTVKTTGLLADGRETNVNYQITYSNLTGRDIFLELWDRIPYTTDDRIKIVVSNSTRKLDEDTTYVQELQPFGLLRWTFNVPAGPASGPQHRLEYTLVVTHRKEIVTTSWPE